MNLSQAPIGHVLDVAGSERLIRLSESHVPVPLRDPSLIPVIRLSDWEIIRMRWNVQVIDLGEAKVL